MKRIAIAATMVFALAASAIAFTSEGNRKFREFLTGLNEAPNVVSTVATGTFRAEISDDETTIKYTLTFNNLEGDVRQAHIHIGLPQNAGGIVLWLCDSDANPSPLATTPACNANNPLDLRNGTVTGTLTEADVQSLAANGIAGPTATTAGEFAEVVALVRAGKTYANVHSAKFGAGEVRSQLDNRGNDFNDHDHGKH
jgi:CHRD domain